MRYFDDKGCESIDVDELFGERRDGGGCGGIAGDGVATTGLDKSGLIETDLIRVVDSLLANSTSRRQFKWS